MRQMKHIFLVFGPCTARVRRLRRLLLLVLYACGSSARCVQSLRKTRASGSGVWRWISDEVSCTMSNALGVDFPSPFSTTRVLCKNWIRFQPGFPAVFLERFGCLERMGKVPLEMREAGTAQRIPHPAPNGATQHTARAFFLLDPARLYLLIPTCSKEWFSHRRNIS